MKDLIYYPSFEPANLNWLKFATIYLDSFSPIIPVSGNSNVTDLFKLLSDHTDLIKPVEPKWWQGDKASTETLDFLDKIEARPDQYRYKFNTPNIIWDLKSPNNWQFELYEEKFNVGFKSEVLKRGFGIESNNGVSVSAPLANLFMTFLSDAISFDEGTDIITDDSDLDALSRYLSTNNPENDKIINAARFTIASFLPDNLETIDFPSLIVFRNSRAELRKEFSNNLENYYKSLEGDFNIANYYNSLNSANLELAKQIGLFFGGATAFLLGALVLADHANTEKKEFIKSILEGSTLAVAGYFAVRSAWLADTSKRKARKFLTELPKIK